DHAVLPAAGAVSLRPPPQGDQERRGRCHSHRSGAREVPPAGVLHLRLLHRPGRGGLCDLAHSGSPVELRSRTDLLRVDRHDPGWGGEQLGSARRSPGPHGSRRADRPAPRQVGSRGPDDRRRPSLPHRPALRARPQMAPAAARCGMSEPILHLDHVSRYFGGLVAVDECSLSLAEGELVGLVGPNGAGKSTLFNLASGYLPPSEGSVTVLGHSTTGRHPAELAALGLSRTFQTPVAFKELTVIDNVLVAARVERPILAGLAGTWR